MEKLSYKFINNIYKSYYSLIKKKRKLLPDYYFTVHNADLFIFIFVFFNLILFKKNINLTDKSKMNQMDLKNYYNLISRRFFDKYNNYFLKNNKLKINKQSFKFKKFFKLLNYNNSLRYKETKNKLEKLDIDKNFKIKNNKLNTYFLNFNLYLFRKVNFMKYNNS
jgi:hypothetical protein